MLATRNRLDATPKSLQMNREGRWPPRLVLATQFVRRRLSRPAERLLQHFQVGLEIGDAAELKVEIMPVSDDVRFHLIDERALTEIGTPQSSDCCGRVPPRWRHAKRLRGRRIEVCSKLDIHAEDWVRFARSRRTWLADAPVMVRLQRRVETTSEKSSQGCCTARMQTANEQSIRAMQPGSP